MWRGWGRERGVTMCNKLLQLSKKVQSTKYNAQTRHQGTPRRVVWGVVGWERERERGHNE